jgi:NDP-sugar pyrophosphorylase family protein
VTAPEQALILVGGLGTRLRPLTLHQPKALLPVANRPLLSYELEWLRRAGVRQAILAVSYQAQVLREGLDRTDWGLEIVYVEEAERRDTAGAIGNCREYLQGSFWALNGDLIFDFDPHPLVAAHRAQAAAVTLTLRRVEDIRPFGLIQRDAAGRVTAFREKVDRDPTGQNTVNAGIYLLEPEVLDYIPVGISYSNERQLFPELVRAGRVVLGYLPPDMGYWSDVGRVETYLEANRAILGGALSWVTPEVAPDTVIEPGAEITLPCSVAEGVVVRAGAQVGPFVSLGTGVEVGAEAVIRDSVVYPGAGIGPRARLEHSVVAGGETVAPGSHHKGEVICHD